MDSSDAGEETEPGSPEFQERFIRYALVVYWGMFWLMNAVDHLLVTDAAPLFKGKYRYDSLYQYFDSIGVDSGYVALAAMNVSTVLEVVAFATLACSLWYTYRGDSRRATDFFVVGMFAGILVMTYFAVGDVVFGDRAELLEHTQYWMFQVVTLVLYLYVPETRISSTVGSFYGNNRKALATVVVVTLLFSSAALATSLQRMDSVTGMQNEAFEATDLGNGVYRVDLAVGAGQDAWERTLDEFRRDHPNRTVVDVRSVPGDPNTVYVLTESCDDSTEGNRTAVRRPAGVDG
ncbi:hypothetical protein BRC81_11100 [Halobacteriales archaeon QS_1_68_20]|nr:MAG: hypothetical protein BRC81_11100 [Halobacteriales archaeon QS_1_68_20]